MQLSYRDAALGATANPDQALVRALQSDLRSLGYLYRFIDGQMGDGTRLAVRRLQYDLLHNDGRSTGADGTAPVSMLQHNRGVQGVTGIVDAALADSIEALLADPNVPKLPHSENPTAANRAALASVAAMTRTVAPTPFIFAIFQQESFCQHYVVPQTQGDTDTFVVVGLDANGATVDQVTSRGYGLGQYTIFHHPPRPEEIAEFIIDPVGNVQKAFLELRDKFYHFVVGSDSETRADDRHAEHPLLALRPCRFAPGDPRYLSACQDCAREAARVDITPTTPLYHLSSQTYGDATAYKDTSYWNVPNRADFQCDWPYAVRRYNGSGPNSFHYQARVLLNLLAGPSTDIGRTA